MRVGLKVRARVIGEYHMWHVCGEGEVEGEVEGEGEWEGERHVRECHTFCMAWRLC